MMYLEAPSAYGQMREVIGTHGFGRLTIEIFM